jgi:hypothetical protein
METGSRLSGCEILHLPSTIGTAGFRGATLMVRSTKQHIPDSADENRPHGSHIFPGYGWETAKTEH